MKMHIAVAVALVATALTSLAQTSGNITISGTVANNTRITVASQSGYDSLNIAGGESGKLVAIVNERSNARLGYTVTLRSLNAGTGARAFLKGSTGNTEEVDYTMTYGGSGVTLGSGVATVTDANAKTTGAGVDKNLVVAIVATYVNADTYTDTLTLTIASK